MNTIQLIAACAIAASLGSAFAHENTLHPTSHGSAQAPAQTPYGQAGKAHAIERTILLQMDDTMRFTPAHLTIKKGQTVRLKVQNRGQAMHEMVLGTLDSLAAHEKMMQAQPDMAHDAPSMAHVAPGREGELVWTFNRAGEFHFACLVAGHWQAGMQGRITVTN